MMENFMNGFPGREHQIRNALGKVLGKEKRDFFFDKFLEYFFTEKDAEFFVSLGFNCVRLSFNYHHFEDDSEYGQFHTQLPHPNLCHSESVRHKGGRLQASRQSYRHCMRIPSPLIPIAVTNTF